MMSEEMDRLNEMILGASVESMEFLRNLEAAREMNLIGHQYRIELDDKRFMDGLEPVKFSWQDDLFRPAATGAGKVKGKHGHQQRKHQLGNNKKRGANAAKRAPRLQAMVPRTKSATLVSPSSGEEEGSGGQPFPAVFKSLVASGLLVEVCIVMGRLIE